MKCVTKLNEALTKLAFIDVIFIDKSQTIIAFNKIENDLSQIDESTIYHLIIKTVTELGYHAEIIEQTYSKSLNQVNEVKNTDYVLAKNIRMSKISTPHQAVINMNEYETKELTQPSLCSQNESLLLSIEGMTCASCVGSIEKTLRTLNVLDEFQVNLASETVLIVGQSKVFPEVIQKLNETGYKATPFNLHASASHLISNENKTDPLWLKTLISLGTGIALMLYGLIYGMSLTESNRIIWLIIGLITLGLLYLTGGHFYCSAWKKLKHKETNMDTLVVLGVSAAFGYSFILTLFPEIMPESERHLYFESSVMIIGLINLGKYIEKRAKKRANAALEQLLDLTPQQAILILPTGESLVDLTTVLPGMLLRLRTGDKVPVDGIIQTGVITLNESLLTGESKEVIAKPNSPVYAGSHVITGSATFLATEVGEKTALAHIIKTVQKAQSSKPKLAKLADKVASIFVPSIIAIAIMTALIWLIFGPTPKLSYALLTSISVLIIACPCALGLAVPISITTSVARAAKLGVLVADASVLERANKIDTLVFDKTGTLTIGKPYIVEILDLTVSNLNAHLDTNGDRIFLEQQSSEKLITEVSWLTEAVSLETGSSHPLALAMKSALEERNHILTSRGLPQPINSMTSEAFENAPGQGIRGVIADKRYVIGNASWLRDNQVDMSLYDTITHQLKTYEQQGSTLIYFSKDNVLTAIFIIQDTLQDSAKNLLHTLSQSFEIWLLTGDNQHNADFIAKSLGLSNVIAEVKPVEKAKHIEYLQSKGQKVAMIGDGINDAPALAIAELSIAMGEGSDIAKQSADYILLKNDLTKLPEIFNLAKQVEKNMKQNLFFAFIYNILLIPVAAGILYPFTEVLLSPMFSALAMALSSITVVINANRLLK
ncbi:heavy metal translocating P-type ATPase [Thorsellia anophelis]|nr:heavy metal translocating P-type ATPase [Thorsellia anophelis]